MKKTKITQLLSVACFTIFFIALCFVIVAQAAEPILLEIEEPKPVGLDWRVMRGYSYGTIHEEQKIQVLYFLYDNGVLAFFLNDEMRISVLNVDTSSFSDPKRAINDLVFEDTDSDGYNDLIIPVSEKEFRVWRWNPEALSFDDEASSIEKQSIKK